MRSFVLMAALFAAVPAGADGTAGPAADEIQTIAVTKSPVVQVGVAVPSLNDKIVYESGMSDGLRCHGGCQWPSTVWILEMH